MSKTTTEKKTTREIFEIPDAIRPLTLSRITSNRLNRAVEDASLGILITDSTLRISYLNARARPLFASLGPVVGKPWIDVLRAHWPEDVAQLVADIAARTLKTGTPYSSVAFSEERIDLKHDESYHWDIHRVTCSDGVNHVLCYFSGPLD